MDISLIIVIIVHSVLEYATTVWDSISNTDKQVLSRAFPVEISGVLCFFMNAYHTIIYYNRV